MKQFFILIIFAFTFSLQPLQAAVEFKRGTVLRDAECEKILKSYTTPIFTKAGLNPENLHLYVICDSELNAFATSQYTIVLHSGLILKAKNVGEVIGVLAHEIGHIAGGHLARFEAVMKKSSVMSMTAAALGILAGITTGQADLGGALAIGAMSSSMGTALHYSRGQEATADQTAVRFLNALHWPANGLVTFMENLSYQELLTSMSQDPYFQTHPLSSVRVGFLKNSIKPETTAYRFPADFEKNFQTLQAKLCGYLNPPGITFLKYPEKDTSFASRYARSIAYYKDNQVEQSLCVLQQLIQDYPSNPYLYELQGQIYYEHGQSSKAIQSLRRAHKLAPTEILINIALAQALSEHNKVANLTEALELLRQVVKIEDDNALAWHLLALTYGKLKNIGMAALSLAEEALCMNKFVLARQQATRAQAILRNQNTHVYLRALDIIRLADEKVKSGDDVDENHFCNVSQTLIKSGY